jgi:archaellum biogenesis ATPase FlaH/ActR/RegA family two-component response regulator
MANVLIVDHQSSIRKSLTSSLSGSGHNVNEATSGKAALEMAAKSRIDLMFLDIELPGAGGVEVLSDLKGNPRTSEIPVIMLTSLPSAETESASLRLGASNVLVKPCSPSDLETMVRIALREGEDAASAGSGGATGSVEDVGMEAPPYDDYQEEEVFAKHSGEPGKFISTGGRLTKLDTALDGGLPVGGLALIEGPSDSGKSVICQYLMHGAISDGWEVAYFTSDRLAQDLGQQMNSIGLALPAGAHEHKLSLHTINRAASGEATGSPIDDLASDIESLPASCGLVVIDGITEISMVSEPRAVMGFFSTFQQLCSAGMAIVVVAQSAAFDSSLLSRLRQLCNSHISMSNESVRGRPVSGCNVTKLNNGEKAKTNGFFFNVEGEFGVKVVPVAQVKI